MLKIVLVFASGMAFGYIMAQQHRVQGLKESMDGMNSRIDATRANLHRQKD